MTAEDFAIQIVGAVAMAIVMTVPGPALDAAAEHRRVAQSRQRFELAATQVCAGRAWRETAEPGEIVCVGRQRAAVKVSK